MFKNIIKVICLVMIFSIIGPSISNATMNSNEHDEINSNAINTLQNTGELHSTEVIKNTNNEQELEVSVENENLLINSKVILSQESEQLSMVEAEIVDEDTKETVKYNFEIADIDVAEKSDPHLLLVDIETGEEYTVSDSQIQASWYPLVVVAIYIARVGINQAIKKFGKTAVKNAVKKHGKKTTTSNAVKKVSMSRLDYHYKKHKKEFGNITKSEYLNKARKLLGASKSKNILEKKSKKKFNGKHRYYKYNKKTNEFLSVEKQKDKDVIITFFKPKRGINYWKDQ
ncbi:SAR2788 family putative toxin [Bacillus safensis]|uniref:SAR2788 family putative toxin n=2 Tax=Bacillus safensis TaxID=561879 RepID=UPI0018CF5F39|nr:SAR2788 family putative toxin [Bacillus safensis]MDI0275424.1 SAR2788 family putative toxin [Bacillus safensis]